MTSKAVACTNSQAVLGEGLRWDARRAELLAVDILAGRVYCGGVADDGGLTLTRGYVVPGTVGAITPLEDDEGWVLATGQRVHVPVPRRLAATHCQGGPHRDSG